MGENRLGCKNVKLNDTVCQFIHSSIGKPRRLGLAMWYKVTHLTVKVFSGLSEKPPEARLLHHICTCLIEAPHVSTWGTFLKSACWAMMATAAATRDTKICGQSNIVQGVLRTRDGHTNIGRRGGGGM